MLPLCHVTIFSSSPRLEQLLRVLTGDIDRFKLLWIQSREYDPLQFLNIFFQMFPIQNTIYQYIMQLIRKMRFLAQV